MARSKPLLPVVIAVSVLMLALAVYFVTRPSATLDAIQRAAASKDFPAMNKLVDFPALRASVKANLVRSLELRMGPSPSAGAQIGAVLGNILIGPTVDLVVSPLGLAFVLQGYSPDETVSNAQSPGRIKADPTRNISHEAHWDSLSQYSVAIRKDGNLISTVALRRYRLFEWKLAAIDLAL